MARSGISLAAALLLLGAAAVTGGLQAARDPAPAAPAATSGLELVVYETSESVYCRLFRRDVLPAYVRSPRAARVPINFADATTSDADSRLSGPITTVPTVVLMRDGVEQSRIIGYTGPETFFHLVSHMLGPTE